MFAIVARPPFQCLFPPSLIQSPDVERQDYQQCGLQVFKFFPADVLARPEMHTTMRDGAQCIMLRGAKFGPGTPN
jgi:hypothetical protein